MLRRNGLIGALLVLALTATGCGGSDSDPGSGGGAGGDTTGVTDTSVKIGAHYPLTGPAAPGYSKIGPAAKAFYDYVNENGGVNGRKIDFVYKDDAYNPANTVQVTRQLVLQDKIFAMVGGLGTPTHTKVVDFLNQSKVPDLFVASGCLCWDEPDKHPYTFGWQSDYYREGKVLGKYVATTSPARRSPTSSRTTTSARTGSRAWTSSCPRTRWSPGRTTSPATPTSGLS